MAELRWADDVAVVLGEDVVLARLPDGPVWVMSGSAGDLAGELDRAGSVDGLLSWAAEAYAVRREDISGDVLAFVAELRAAGLLAT